MVSLTEWAFGRLIIVVVTAATVTSIVAGTVGYFAGRNSVDNNSQAATRTKPSPDARIGEPAPSPTAVVPSSTEAATPADDSGPVGAPTRVNEFGVPVGYPHTEAGAISACGNYVAITSVAKNRERSRSHQIIRSISDEETATRLSNLLTEIDTETASNFNVPSVISPQFTLNHRVIGYRVNDHRDSESKIEVLSGIAAGVPEGSPNLQPSMHWGTDICTVTWDGSDWKLRDVSGGSEGHAMTERSSESFERFTLAGVTS